MARSGSRSGASTPSPRRAGRGASSRSTSGSGSSTPSPRGAGRGPGRGASAEAPPPRLWAPWRLEFIEAPKPTGCIFCQLPSEEGEANDRKNLIVHRSARSFSVLNRYPYNPGHLMVIPRAHLADLDALSPEEFGDLHEELRLAARVLRKAYRPQGLNLGMNLGQVAGAGIADHLHYHLVPRWGGDTNFMPVLADTRVMVEHLDGAWRKLRDGFELA